MYITSTQLQVFSEHDLVSLEQQGHVKFPQPYRDFLKTYGGGTYGGAICINGPDFNLLKQYAEEDFWEYDNSPIRREQMKECVVIGNSIDGDYITVHPAVRGYILLPRDSEQIELFPDDAQDFLCTVNKIASFLYDEELEEYFDPGGNDYLFLHYSGKNVEELIACFQAAFPSDYLIDDEYACKVFFLCMGGHVRMSRSKGFEVAVFYSKYGLDFFETVKKFLCENGCV